MKKILQGLAVAVLATGAVNAHDDTNKTFLMPRPQGVNLPMEITTYKDLIPRKLDDRYGATVAVTPFFQQSADHDETAEYFLFKHKSTVTLRTSETQIASDDRFVYSDVTNDLDINYLLHDYNITTNPYSADVSLDPEQTAYGARIDYHQNLGSILKNLYLKADMPIVHVENNPKLWVGNVTAGDWPGNLADDLRNYLEGKYENRVTGEWVEGNPYTTRLNIINLQEKLTKAKILKNSTTGVADIDVALGYKFINSEKYLFALALATTIPTGNKETGEYMFQAIAGNGRHWGFGADLCASARAWGKINHNIKLSLKMKYRYLFENDANRTLGINDPRGLRDWGHYHLLAANPSLPARPLIPAANITTLRVDVTPGSQFDGVFDFTYNNGGFNFDLGYNLYYRDRENVERKQDLTASSYAVASRGFDTSIGGGTEDTHNGVLMAFDIDGNLATLWYVDNAHLNTSVAETPSQLTNSIYGGMGYTTKNWDIPLMMGIGGKYEFASNNAALEQWSVWGKMGVTF